MVKLSDELEKLIEAWQNSADELKEKCEELCGENVTISAYKAMHMLWRTVCNIIEDLDTIAHKCEIAEVAEDCGACGFCEIIKSKGETK